MRAQRPSILPEAIDATAEDLPFSDAIFDATLATFTIHQWPNLVAGYASFIASPPDRLSSSPAIQRPSIGFGWSTMPRVPRTEAQRYPAPARVAELLGGTVDVRVLPVPLDCTDGFGEAYYGRRKALLDPGARLANSAWSFVGRAVERRFEQDLRRDLESAVWDAEHGALRTLPKFEGSLRLIVADSTSSR
ncbi:MAG TPA: SAM-dependent methyltransferase [Microbacteriaceae bacterium]